jgi:hypothetical protein
MAEAPFGRAVRGGPDIAKPVAGIVDAVGDWISDDGFSTKTLFARRPCMPPVLFGTANLSGLYPFATASAHDRNGFLRRVNAMTSGRAGRRVLAWLVSLR